MLRVPAAGRHSLRQERMNKLLPDTVSTNDFFDALTKLGGAVVGLSLFAYIAGYVKAVAMYKAIGGGWVVEFLTSQDILRVGSYSLVMVGVVTLAGTYIFHTRGWVWLKILSFWITGSVVCFFMFAPKAGWGGDWFASFSTADFIIGLSFLSSGCLLACAGYVYVNAGLTRMVFLLALLGGLISLYLTPNYLGRLWGYEVLTAQTALPKTSDLKSDCYLLGSVNSKYLIGCVSNGKMIEMKMVEIDKDVSFQGR